MLTIDQIRHAAEVLSSVVRRTDLIRAPRINCDSEIYLKTENLQVTGSFKVRGAYYKISQLTEEEKKRGVIACSAGNHAQGVALGATKTETVFKVIVPAAKSGILTSVVLGIGRSIGEAMAVMMVSGKVANMPGHFKSVRFLTTAVASEMSYSSGLQRQALFSIALVLFVFIMMINAALNFFLKKDKEQSGK